MCPLNSEGYPDRWLIDWFWTIMINDQMINISYYLTWRNYQSLKLSAYCDWCKDRTQYRWPLVQCFYQFSHPAPNNIVWCGIIQS
jgi:hypothetical protein